MKWLKQIGLVTALSGVVAFGPACSSTNSMLGRGRSTWSMNNAAQAPAAEGKVEVSPGKDGNHDVKVEVKHLAAPAEAYQGTTNYVVWIKPEGAPPRNIGVLHLKDEKADLETKTPYTRFEVMVTAEHQPDATRPSDNVVLERRVEVAT